MTPAQLTARTLATPPPDTAAPRQEAQAEEGEEDRSLQAGSHFPAPPLAADTLGGVTTPRAAGEWQTEAAGRSEPERRPRDSGCSADSTQGTGPRRLERSVLNPKWMMLLGLKH